MREHNGNRCGEIRSGGSTSREGWLVRPQLTLPSHNGPHVSHRHLGAVNAHKDSVNLLAERRAAGDNSIESPNPSSHETTKGVNV
jgi:hypothetical protein